MKPRVLPADQGPIRDPDSDLIPLMQKGDQAAFARLVERRTGTLTALAANMLGDAFMAEDVVQSTYLKTWSMLPSWQAGQGYLISWMRKVTTRQCLDILRRKTPIFTDEPPETVDGAPTPLAALERENDGQHVRAALSRLNPDQQAAITLTYYQNLPQKEAAHILDKSLPAYDSLLRRARAQLKSYLKNGELS